MPSRLPSLFSPFQRRIDAAVEQATTAQLAARSKLVARLDSINNFLSGLGTAGDKGAVARPDVWRQELTWQELTSLYRFNGYARRFIDLLPYECTRAGWRVLDGTDEQDPLRDWDDELAISSHFAELDRWSRLYGGALLLPVFDEDIPPSYHERSHEWLRQPMQLERLGRLVNLVVLDPFEFAAVQWESNLRDANFRRPRFWQIAPQTDASYAGMEQLGMSGGYIHHSRVLYMPGATLPNSLRFHHQGLDDSVLQAVWDQLRHKTSSDQGIASLMQEIKLNVVRVEGLAAMSTGDQAEYFELRMRQIAQGKSLNNLVILDAGEDLQQLSAQVSGMGDLDDRSRTALAAVTGIPQVIFYGDTPGGLNTDGDSHRRIWDKVVSAYQDQKYREPLTRLYSMVFASQDGPEVPDSWELEFHSLDEPTDREQAEIEKLHAEADQIRIQAGILPAEHITSSRYGTSGYQRDLMPYDDPLADVSTPSFGEGEQLLGDLGGE